MNFWGLDHEAGNLIQRRCPEPGKVPITDHEKQKWRRVKENPNCIPDPPRQASTLFPQAMRKQAAIPVPRISLCIKFRDCPGITGM
ncbi:MAG: hypothetical protein H7222_14425 [Methylotenera sp.]|nr:hypothetical protein [Oligoflexia bacterium]